MFFGFYAVGIQKPGSFWFLALRQQWRKQIE
jgi:hypothetical protein